MKDTLAHCGPVRRAGLIRTGRGGWVGVGLDANGIGFIADFSPIDAKLDKACAADHRALCTPPLRVHSRAGHPERWSSG